MDQSWKFTAMYSTRPSQSTTHLSKLAVQNVIQPPMYALIRQSARRTTTKCVQLELRITNISHLENESQWYKLR